MDECVNVIIWGADNHNSLGLLRQLSTDDMNVVFANIGRKKSYTCASKFCTNSLYVPINDFGLETLIDKFGAFINKTILLTSGDGTAEFVDIHRAELSKHFILSGTSKEGLLTEIDNKNIMAEIARRHGFNVPPSITYSCKTIIPHDFSFPAVLKPVIASNGFREFKYKYFKDARTLVKFNRFLNPANIYILQKFIPKSNDVVIYGVRLNNGELILAGRYIKDRWSDDGGGSHGKLVGSIPLEFNPKGIKTFLEEIDYYGLFSVEYGVFNGIPWFYEFNLRNDATSHLFFQSGANLPLKWCYNCLGKDNIVETKIKGTHWNINEIYDITNVFKGRITYSTFKRERQQAEVFYFYDLNDLKPYIMARRKALYDVPFRMILKFMRPYLTWLIWRFKLCSRK